jgi:hypothetical protein
LFDLAIHRLDVRGAIEVASDTEGDAILRIETDHRDFAIDVPADTLEDFLENPGLKVERRSDIEFEAARGRDRRTSSSDNISRFQHGDFGPSVG